jgi:membrane dipeptidase
MGKPMNKVIDLHCDTLFECHSRGVGLQNRELAISLDKRPPQMHICQAMAIFIPDELRGQAAEDHFEAVYRLYERQIQQHREEIAPIQDVATIDDALEKFPWATILTVEGGAALAGKLANIRKLYDYGVRVMTLTWNAANEIAGGCATNEGFTAFGRQAIREMENVGMVVDVSHLSDKGFAELCDQATRPFIATHSNARAVCNHRRNLTDAMFAEIRDRGGIVGLNYYNDFIVEEGASASIVDLLKHVHHFLDLGGEDTLALGSDFDGADIPPYLDSVEKIVVLFEAMEKSGIPADVVEKIRYGNAERFFRQVISNRE